jgi:hypothetical protein
MDHAYHPHPRKPKVGINDEITGLSHLVEDGVVRADEEKDVTVFAMSPESAVYWVISSET